MIDKRVLFIGLPLLILVGIFISTNRSQSQSIQQTPPTLPNIQLSPSPTRPADCIPLPKNIYNDLKSPPTPAANIPSVTPIPFKNTIDLSPDIAMSSKWETIVFRCDGSFDRYLTGPNLDPRKAISLGPGDVIILAIPPSSMMGVESPNLYHSDTSPSPQPNQAYPLPMQAATPTRPSSNTAYP
jgi:hypothetical protein